MIEIFISVIIVICVMSLFLFLILRKVVKRLNDKVKSEFIKNLNVYDEIIEQKSTMLHELEQKIEISNQVQNYEGTSEEVYNYDTNTVLIEQGSYINGEFFKHYSMIQKDFKDPAYEETKKKVYELSRYRKDLNVHEYREIQNLFTHDLQYEILTLTSHDEKIVFDLISQHSHAKKKILDSYLNKFQVFDFMEFMMYVKDYIRAHDSTVYVYSRDGRILLEDSPKHVVYLEDSTINEGYKICYRDQVFDFSL